MVLRSRYAVSFGNYTHTHDNTWWDNEAVTIQDALGSEEETAVQKLLAHYEQGGEITSQNTIPGQPGYTGVESRIDDQSDAIAQAIERRWEEDE